MACEQENLRHSLLKALANGAADVHGATKMRAGHGQCASHEQRQLGRVRRWGSQLLADE
jgi:hypothetical protein